MILSELLIHTETCAETISVMPNPRDRYIRWLDGGILACLVILTAGLPYAAITTSREIGLLGGLSLWIIRMIVSRRWEFVKTPLDLPLALLLIVGMLSCFTAVDRAYTFSELRGEMIKCMLIYYLAVNNLKTEKRAKIVFGALLASTLVMDAYGLIHYFSQGGLLWVNNYREGGLTRGCQELTTFLVQTAPFIMMGLVWFKMRWVRMLLGLFLFLHVVTLQITFSRIGLLALVIEVGLVLFLLGLSRKVIVVLVAATLITLAFIMPKPILVVGDKAKDMPHVGGLGVMEQGRSALWLKAFDYLKEHPFSGIGFGRQSFEKKFPEMRLSNHQAWHAHSTFVNLALELGIQGLIVFLFLLYRIFRRLWTGRGLAALFLRGSLSGAVMAAAWVMTAGYFIRNLTDDLYNNDSALLFWLLVGCAFSLKIFVVDRARAHRQSTTPAGP